jgi:UDP-glucose 4-epimerase
LKKILVTGGLGYIGSHACLALLTNGYYICILDNLCNSNIEVLNRLEKISNRKIKFVRGDIRNQTLLEKLFEEESFDAVVHFAGLKSVSESVTQPIDYYNTNVFGTLVLLDVMSKSAVNTIVFSSSASVYGEPKELPIKEHFPLQATNPYARSKIMIEEILMDLHQANSNWNIIGLRYFNPIGAHESGFIGEDPRGIPCNLLPYVAQVAVGRQKSISVFGNDYPTRDGTGIRDYIHVVDLADAHVAALNYLKNKKAPLFLNLGTGQGVSVLEIIQTFQEASSIHIPFEIRARRPGDVAECWADPGVAEQLIGWSSKKNLYDMCLDAWRWQKQNPDGY